MFCYLFPPFFALIFAVFNSKYKKNICFVFYVITVFISIFIYCGVYTNGTDWPNYEMMYDALGVWDVKKVSESYDYEFGFCFIVYLLRTLGLSFFASLILMKTFSMIMLSEFFRYYANNYGKGYSANVFLLLFFFYTTNCMYLYVETIIRFALALGFVSWSYRYMINRKIVPFCLCILAAVMFHISSLLMFPIYFVKRIRVSNKYLFLIFSFLFVFLSPALLLFLFEPLEPYLPPLVYLPLKGYLTKAVIEDSTMNGLGNIVYFFFLIVCLMARRKVISLSKDGEILFAFTMIYFLLFYLTLHAGSIGRIALYLSPIFSVFFITSLSVNRFFQSIILGGVLMYLFMSLVKDICFTDSFLPYSNYFFYLVS